MPVGGWPVSSIAPTTKNMAAARADEVVTDIVICGIVAIFHSLYGGSGECLLTRREGIQASRAHGAARVGFAASGRPEAEGPAADHQSTVGKPIA